MDSIAWIFYWLFSFKSKEQIKIHFFEKIGQNLVLGLGMKKVSKNKKPLVAFLNVPLTDLLKASIVFLTLIILKDL